MRPLTSRQRYALVAVYDGRVTSTHRKSCPSLVGRGLVRDCGPRKLERWEITPEGTAEAERIRADLLAKLRAGTL